MKRSADREQTTTGLKFSWLLKAMQPFGVQQESL